MREARELEILRKMLVSLIVKKGVHITAQNEFHREMVGFAKDLGIEVEELRSIIVPILSELFSAMIAEPAKSSGHKTSLPGGIFMSSPVPARSQPTAD